MLVLLYLVSSSRSLLVPLCLLFASQLGHQGYLPFLDFGEVYSSLNGAVFLLRLKDIEVADFQSSMDSLMKMPEKPMDMSVIHSFMGRVKTEEARKGIQLADELSDMILFHAMVCENGKKMEQSWENK